MRAIGCVAALLAGLAASATVAAQDIAYFRIATGSIGGTYFPVGSMLADIISNPPGSPACDVGGSCGVPGLIGVAQASNGSVDNVGLIADGAVESALGQADVAYWAHTGTGLFAGQPPMEGLRAIATLYTETLHVVVPAASPAQTVADLEGQRVSVGVEGSGVLLDSQALLAAYGLDLDDIVPVYKPPDESADLMAKGELDGLIFIGGVPVLAIADLAKRIPVRILPLADAETDALLRQERFFTPAVIEAEAYAGIGEVPTIGVGALWLVGADLDPELVHGLTAALWNSNVRAVLDGGHPRGRDIQLATALRGMSVPLHPGAERYYREAGVLAGTGEAETATEPAEAEDDAPALATP